MTTISKEKLIAIRESVKKIQQKNDQSPANLSTSNKSVIVYTR